MGTTLAKAGQQCVSNKMCLLFTSFLIIGTVMMACGIATQQSADFGDIFVGHEDTFGQSANILNGADFLQEVNLDVDMNGAALDVDFSNANAGLGDTFDLSTNSSGLSGSEIAQNNAAQIAVDYDNMDFSQFTSDPLPSANAAPDVSPADTELSLEQMKAHSGALEGAVGDTGIVNSDAINSAAHNTAHIVGNGKTMIGVGAGVLGAGALGSSIHQATKAHKKKYGKNKYTCSECNGVQTVGTECTKCNGSGYEKMGGWEKSRKFARHAFRTKAGFSRTAGTVLITLGIVMAVMGACSVGSYNTGIGCTNGAVRIIGIITIGGGVLAHILPHASPIINMISDLPDPVSAYKNKDLSLGTTLAAGACALLKPSNYGKVVKGTLKKVNTLTGSYAGIAVDKVKKGAKAGLAKVKGALKATGKFVLRENISTGISKASNWMSEDKRAKTHAARSKTVLGSRTTGDGISLVDRRRLGVSPLMSRLLEEIRAAELEYSSKISG